MFPRHRARKSADMSCVFVHAGAGYHSVENESYHLQACADACKSAMLVMKNGGSAVDAVEMAIKVLEDREITNAGYGSNPNVDGVVECDAIVVDHLGRSGAAGAVAQIKNPVSLARVLLDSTSRPLTLRRVPPNLLVGQGATNFAYEHGMPVLPHAYLVSPVARQRWQKWRSELNRAEKTKTNAWNEHSGSSPAPTDQDLNRFFEDMGNSETIRQGHEKAMLRGMINDTQPKSSSSPIREHDSSSPAPPMQSRSSWSLPSPSSRGASRNTTPDHIDEHIDSFDPPSMLMNTARSPFGNSTQKLTSASSLSRSTTQEATNGSDDLDELYCDGSRDATEPVSAFTDLEADLSRLSTQPSETNLEGGGRPYSESAKSPNPYADSGLAPVSKSQLQPEMDERVDHITDTIGAIAIDSTGNIACAASSGGIGMKHRGRVGPAALIGVGAAVIPADSGDECQTTVSTVTSGTGEHMATTVAASVCSERVFQSHRRDLSGRYTECTEDEAINGFIKRDFLDHPSVKGSNSNGAIGVLSVKKTKDGAWLYFGHNTDSFALASMHSEESRPVCTMSRSMGSGAIAQGGRAIRFRKRR